MKIHSVHDPPPAVRLLQIDRLKNGIGGLRSVDLW
jgi:hypothetical protein